MQSDSQTVGAIGKNWSFYVIYHPPRLTVIVFFTLNKLKKTGKCCKIKLGFWWGHIQTLVTKKLIGCRHRQSHVMFSFSFWLIWCFIFENRPTRKIFIKVRALNGNSAAMSITLFWWAFYSKQTHRNTDRQTHRYTDRQT